MLRWARGGGGDDSTSEANDYKEVRVASVQPFLLLQLRAEPPRYCPGRTHRLLATRCACRARVRRGMAKRWWCCQFRNLSQNWGPPKLIGSSLTRKPASPHRNSEASPVLAMLLAPSNIVAGGRENGKQRATWSPYDNNGG